MLKNILISLDKLDNFSLSGEFFFTKSINKGIMTEFIVEKPFLILKKQPYFEADSNQFKNVCSIDKSLNKNLNKIRELFFKVYSEFNFDNYNYYTPFQEHNPYLSKLILPIVKTRGFFFC